MRATSDAEKYAQALAKIERGHATDLRDVREMAGRALVGLEALARRFDTIAADLARYPAIDDAYMFGDGSRSRSISVSMSSSLL